MNDDQTTNSPDGALTRVLEITLYGRLLYIPLENVDAVMEADDMAELPDDLRGLLSTRGVPFMIHGVIDNFILKQMKKSQISEITDKDIQAVIDLDDPYFGTLLAVAAGSNIIFHPNVSETPYVNASIQGVSVNQAIQRKISYD